VGNNPLCYNTNVNKHSQACDAEEEQVCFSLGLQRRDFHCITCTSNVINPSDLIERYEASFRETRLSLFLGSPNNDTAPRRYLTTPYRYPNPSPLDRFDFSPRMFCRPSKRPSFNHPNTMAARSRDHRRLQARRLLGKQPTISTFKKSPEKL
jgi:hypothetical protein